MTVEISAPHFTNRPKRGRARCSHETYGLTCEQADALWVEAQACCQICGVSHDDTWSGLYIDHHATVGYNAVRGLLCSNCNRRLDDPRLWPWPADFAYNAAHYLLNAWYLRAGAPPVLRRKLTGWDYTYAITYHDNLVHRIWRWRYGANGSYCGVDVFTPLLSPDEAASHRIPCERCNVLREESQRLIAAEMAAPE